MVSRENGNLRLSVQLGEWSEEEFRKHTDCSEMLVAIRELKLENKELEPILESVIGLDGMLDAPLVSDLLSEIFLLGIKSGIEWRRRELL